MLEQNPETGTEKRDQILDGARKCFLRHGFDGTSMNDIVKAAGVSKGTIYAYFPSKERLFEALVYQDRRRQAEQIIAISEPDRPIRDVLYELGLRFATVLKNDESIAYTRMAIAVAGKFPEIGRTLYEAGPMYAIQHVAEYFELKIADGTLKPQDAELLACRFIDLVNAGIIKPLIFGMPMPDAKESIETKVQSAVDLFLGGALRAR